MGGLRRAVTAGNGGGNGLGRQVDTERYICYHENGLYGRRVRKQTKCFPVDALPAHELYFFVVVGVATWGVSQAPNIVLKIISGVVLTAVALGGVIADIKGMIDSIRYRI